MLRLVDVCKTFNAGTVNAKVALDHLNLTLEDGDFVTVIGSNGAGKSTALNAIAGTFMVDKGQILLNDKDLDGDSSGYADRREPCSCCKKRQEKRSEMVHISGRKRKIP